MSRGTKTFNAQQEIADLKRRIESLELARNVQPINPIYPTPPIPPAAPMGCVCPVGTEWNCRSQGCPRRGAAGVVFTS